MKATYVYVLSEDYDERYHGIYESLKGAKKAVTSNKWKRVDDNTWVYSGLNAVWKIKREKVQS